jgi:uncharacterized Zn finger protein (UPF0148 family)
MSDDFDKEAEREKLREKYERDQQKRQATEQMSELLLKGATMTNAHCSDCGDPIFRYDDQEFCPTCEKPVERDTGDEEETEEGGQDSEEIEVTTPSDEARVAFGDDDANGADSDGTAADAPDPAGAAEGEAQAQDTSQQAQRPSAAASGDAGLPAQHEQELPRQHEQDLPSTDRAETDTGRTRSNAHAGERESARGEASVTAARESLVVTLTRFSRLAEQTEDPRRAQEYLAAAREAAETLAELRR